jgi:predicted dienelactone hydrolase
MANTHTLRALAALVTGLVALAAQAQVGLSTLPSYEPPLTLFYPTDAHTRSVEQGPFRLDVAPDAAPTPGRHRLIVISHGAGGSSEPDHALAAALARAGFVVAQVTHEGDNFRDQRWSGPESFRRRPGEVVRAIHALAADPSWSARLDLSKVGVHGMSAGGVTALSLAGAQWNLLTMVRHCNAHLEEDIGFCLNGAPTPEAQAARRQRFEAARNVPDAFLPADMKQWHGGRTPTAEQPDPRPDPRIVSVTLAVPVAAIFSPESLGRIQIPVGIVSAQNDRLLLPRFHSARLLAHCSRCHSLVDLPGTGHMDLMRPWPDALAREVASKQARGGEPTPGLNPALLTDAHAKIVAFHRQHLNPP